MDTCKIGPGLYISTHLLMIALTTAPSDRPGKRVFAVKVQERLKEYGIKFRPNKPGAPHLSGKVERSQKTDKAEFYATVDLSTDDLEERLAELL